MPKGHQEHNTHSVQLTILQKHTDRHWVGWPGWIKFVYDSDNGQIDEMVIVSISTMIWKAQKPQCPNEYAVKYKNISVWRTVNIPKAPNINIKW